MGEAPAATIEVGKGGGIVGVDEVRVQALLTTTSPTPAINRQR
jgi:hypothetical protein